MSNQTPEGFAMQQRPETEAVAAPVENQAERILELYGRNGWSTPEIVTTEEVDAIIKISDNILNLSGEHSVLPTGEDVTVSECSIPHTLSSGEEVFLRLMRYGKPRKINRGSPKNMYLVYDKEESVRRLRIDNPNFITIEIGDEDGRSRGIYNEGEFLVLPRFNEPEVVEFVRETIMKLYNRVDDIRELSETERALAMQKRIATAKRLWAHTRKIGSDALAVPGNQADRVSYWWQGKSQSKKEEIIMSSIVGGLIFGLLTAGGLALASSDTKGPVAKFDDEEFVLEDGTEIAIGETANPEYSFELLQSEELSLDSVPELTTAEDEYFYGPVVYEGETADEKADINNLREIVINSSEEGDNSETHYIKLGSKDDTIKVWTDSKEHAGDIDVTLNDDNIKVTWNGQELNDEDDPRVVIQRVPSSED